jgi:hypothetical protein
MHYFESWACSLRGVSITDGWLKPDFDKEILVRPMSSISTSTSSQSVSCMGMYVDSIQNSLKVKTNFLLPSNNEMTSLPFSSVSTPYFA